MENSTSSTMGYIAVASSCSNTSEKPKSNSNHKMTDSKASLTTEPTEKYHALIIDSGAIIKQSTFTHLHHSAKYFYTVPAVLNEVRDAKSRQHLEEFQMRLASLPANDDGEGIKLKTRLPSPSALAAVSEFARKTGDYPQLSGVDLQILALLYELECEACETFGNSLGHIRREPKRVLGVSVRPLNGDGKRAGRGAKGCADSVSGETNASEGGNSSNTSLNETSFFRGNADGIIDAAQVDFEYDDDEFDEETRADSVVTESAISTAAENRNQSSWAMLVNPNVASTAPPLNYSLVSTSNHIKNINAAERLVDPLDSITKDTADNIPEVHGQFDDASESSGGDNSFGGHTDSDGEARAIQIANAHSDEEMSDEECDVFILEPHEAAYYKKLKEQELLNKKKHDDHLVAQLRGQSLSTVGEGNQPLCEDDAGLDSEFPSLAAAADVPYDGSDDEYENENDSNYGMMTWEEQEEERKKKSLQPMVNGKIQSATPKYKSFRKYGHLLSSDGSASSIKKTQQKSKDEKEPDAVSSLTNEKGNATDESETTSQKYKSRIMESGGATSSLDAPTEMTADDDDGEGWVTCTRDIQSIKATGSLHLPQSGNVPNYNNKSHPPKNPAPPITQRAACATTDFAMQNVILQMNLELLTVDGVRVRRLKTWVTRCAACFTIYGSDDKKGKIGGRLFCDKCGSNALQRIAASVDRNTGRLKLHMKKHYQYNTRGTKFSLPKAGKGNKYEGDLLLAEDQLLYGAWAQKVRKGKSKALGESMFGSDLASDLGCRADLTKRDDIKVGFGRRNPNSTKFGRERRGKKKKNTQEKACGLRRY